MRRTLTAAAAALTLLAPAAASASERLRPTLLGRAILPSDAYQPGPPSGALVAPDNGVTPPFPGQPIPGFSAVLDAGGGEFLGLPDNGYGSKGNSADFLLRLYRIAPRFRTARGGSGAVEVRGFIQLRDPDGKVPFALTRPDRLLTGADFDIESIRRAGDGTFWIGEEFGPFLLHVDASGRVLEAPFPLPGVQSPQNPYLADPDAWTVPASRGFEGMAMSPDRRYLYPVVEGALRNDPDRRRRVVHEFDIRAGAYTGRTWTYRTDAGFPDAVIGDFTAIDAHRFVAIERDDAQGAEARQKKLYVVDLRRTDASGALVKTLAADLLDIDDPGGVSAPARPGEYGVGERFSFPLQSVESVEVLGGERLLVANDNNYPGSDGRWTARDRPDDTELIVLRAPALRGPAGGGARNATTVAVIGDTPYGAAQVETFDDLVQHINDDPQVDLALHVGDIKNGSSPCSDEYFAFIRSAFDAFEDPLVYTPGDNEWTDCHRASNGGYVPTERLDALRSTFFASPDAALGGRRLALVSQDGFPENARWTRSRTVFATIHAVGSNNGLAPWFGGAETAEQREDRLAEVAARRDAGLAWIDAAFDEAEDTGAEGVVLAMQADTWVTGDVSGFTEINARIADRAAASGRPVLLIQGDSHRYLVDRPIASAPNLTRIVVEGETTEEWLELKVDPRAAELFSWSRRRR